MNTGGFPQHLSSTSFNPRGTNFDGGMDPYPINEQPGNRMMPPPLGFGMMPQQSGSAWGMDQQPGSMMPQQMNPMWMPSQPSNSSTTTDESNLNTSHQGSMNMGHPSGITLGHQGGMNMGQQGRMNIGQQDRLNMGQQSGLNMGQQSSMNMGQQGGLNMGQQGGLNMGQQGSMNMGQQGGLNMGQQGSMNMGQQDGLNMGQQSSMHVGQQGRLNMGQQGSMNMGQQGGMNLGQQGPLNMGQLGIMNMAQQGGLNMGQQSEMNVTFQGGMNNAYPGGMNRPQNSMNLPPLGGAGMGQQSSMNMTQQDSMLGSQQGTVNMGLPQQSRMHMMNSGGLSMPQQPDGFDPIPRQDNFFSSNSNPHFGFMQQGGGDAMHISDQQGNTGPGIGRLNNSSGFQQGNQVSNTSFQQPMTGRICSGGPTLDIGEKLDEFYASIKAGPKEPSQHPSASDVDHQSSTVSSSIDSGLTEMQKNIGLKLLEISGQVGTGKSRLGKGSMSKAVSEKLKSTVPQEPDSSTSTQQAPPSATIGSSGDNKPSAKFEDDDTDYCKLCNIYFTSQAMYAFHVRGVTHIQRLVAVEAGVDRKPADKPFIVSGRNFTQAAPPASGKHPPKHLTVERKTTEDSFDADFLASLYCDVCELQLNSEFMLQRHMSGRKHTRAVKARSREKTLLQEVREHKKALYSEYAVEEESDFDKCLSHLPPDEPVVGLQYVVETMFRKEEVCFCELCDTQCYRNNMVQHVIGRKHRLAYLKLREVDGCDLLTTKKGKRDLVRKLCMELEETDGRGKPRYRGPPKQKPKPVAESPRPWKREYTPPVTRSQLREEQPEMSSSEKKQAIESLKRILLDDFKRRDIEQELANKIVESRLELLKEYERLGVPFVVARERVIEEEERWNLLLEFERQILPFEEAEQRIDHRFQLMRMYEKNGYPSEEARRKVLDDEVILDFKNEFLQLGLRRDQAKKLAEKRLWMLETLHYQGLTPEEASHKVITIEQELKDSLRHMHETESRGGSGDSEAAQWIVIGEELERFVISSSEKLGLTSEQSQSQLRVVRESLERYKEKMIPPEEAKCRVLVDDLSTPPRIAAELSSSQSKPRGEQPAALTAHEPGSQADISYRVQQFLSKMKSQMPSVVAPGTSQSEEKKPKEPETEEEREKLLEEYDQQSRLEIQNLLSEMLKMNIPADEARKRLVALYNQHENLRENLFPVKKSSKTSVKTDKPGTAKTLQQKETHSGQQPSEETQPTKENNVKEGSSSKPKESSHKAQITSGKDKPARESKGASSSSQKVEKESSSTKDSRKGETESQVSKQSREGHSSRHRSKHEESSTQSKDRKSPRQSGRSTSGDSRGHSKLQERKDRSADDRWKASVEMFLQQYGLKKDDFQSHSSRRHSGDHRRYSPSDLSPRTSRQRSPIRGSDHLHSGGWPRSSSGSKPRPLSDLVRRRVRGRRQRVQTQRRPDSAMQSRVSGENGWQSPNLGYRSRLMSIERELNRSPDFSRRSPLLHHHHSPERYNDSCPDRQRGWSPDRQRGWSPNEQRGWSPGRQRGWSPNRQRGWSPDKHRGWSPDKQRGWSPDRQMSPERERSPGRPRFVRNWSHSIRSRRIDSNNYTPKDSCILLPHSRRPQRSPTPSPERGRSRRGDHDRRTPTHKDRRARSRSPPRDPHFSFRSGVWEDELAEDLGKYQDW